MNKHERHLVKMHKYYKRLRNLGIDLKVEFFALRSSGKPCSCAWCVDRKYRQDRAKEKLNVLNEVTVERSEIEP